MARSLEFVRLETSLKGLISLGIKAFDRCLDTGTRDYRWVCIEDPQCKAQALEILAQDLPEEDLAHLIPKLPYLILLFQQAQQQKFIPVEATFAFLSVLNRSGLVTVMRQCSDQTRLASFLGLESNQWLPVFFLAGGVLDLDLVLAEETPSNCSFF